LLPFTENANLTDNISGKNSTEIINCIDMVSLSLANWCAHMNNTNSLIAGSTVHFCYSIIN